MQHNFSTRHGRKLSLDFTGWLFDCMVWFSMVSVFVFCCLFFSVLLGFSSFHSFSCGGGDVPIVTSRGIMGGQPKQAAGKHRIRGDINTLIVGAPCDAFFIVSRIVQRCNEGLCCVLNMVFDRNHEKIWYRRFIAYLSKC